MSLRSLYREVDRSAAILGPATPLFYNFNKAMR